MVTIARRVDKMGGANLDRAITALAEKYAAVNLEDFERFHAAIADGRLEVVDSELG